MCCAGARRSSAAASEPIPTSASTPGPGSPPPGHRIHARWESWAPGRGDHQTRHHDPHVVDWPREDRDVRYDRLATTGAPADARQSNSTTRSRRCVSQFPAPARNPASNFSPIRQIFRTAIRFAMITRPWPLHHGSRVTLDMSALLDTSTPRTVGRSGSTLGRSRDLDSANDPGSGYG